MILFTDQLRRANAKDPIVGSSDIKGGIHSVKTYTDLENLSTTKLEAGMLCYVQDENKYYKYTIDKTWEEAKFGGEGIPMYDQEIFEQLQNKGELPEKYITIPNKSQDLNVTALSREIPKTGTYVDILFSAIRSLQHEVAKLKNTFNYGIESYTGTNTASNRVISETEAEDEPLWAIDPESLAELEDLDISLSSSYKLSPINAFIKNEEKNFIEFISDCSADLNTEGTEESKICVYLRIKPTDSDWKVVLQLSNESSEVKEILLRGPSQRSNILIIINRNSWDDNEEPIGKNFIWVQQTDEYNNVLQQGYYNNGDLVSSLIETDYFNTKRITFNKLQLYQCSVYVKDSSFSADGDSIIGYQPITDDFTFKAAHLTIRSIETREKLEQVKDRLLNNELIWVENTNRLYIKSNYKIVAVGSGTISDDDNYEEEVMDTQQLTEWLVETGLVNYDGVNYSLVNDKLNPFESIVFKHEGSGKTFNISVDAEGNFKSAEQHKLKSLVQNPSSDTYAYRGAVAYYQLGDKLNTEKGADLATTNKDKTIAKGDRLRISSWYAPIKDQLKFNCSHDFIELTNCSTEDIPLDNIKLHIVKNLALKNPIDGSYVPLDPKDPFLYSFLLNGYIPAGGTYTIRGKQRLSIDSQQAYVKVNSFDYELWDNSELLDLEETQAIILLHKDSDFGSNISSLRSYKFFEKDSTTEYFLCKVHKDLIDLVLIGSETLKVTTSGSAQTWATKSYAAYENTITKDQYFLDPAKQAFRSLSSKTETSNCRLDAVAAEYIPLDDEYITFYHSPQKIHVSKFGPQSSNKHKNVCSDKTNLNQNKPNFVQCSFGINAATTRCFNWVSAGNQDEFLWLREKGTDSWKKFESYKENEEVPESLSFPRKKVFDVNIINPVYARIRGTFPANGTSYTSHKLIIEVIESALQDENKKTYEYIVGKSFRNGQPDFDHCSDIKTFTLYGTSYIPKIFQTTDQQGFGWMEYQVWSAAAKELYNKIKEECPENGLYFPVCVNTGDMTQNGTRVNEWLDYYLGMEEVAAEYEQMNVVGNNDLANSYSPDYLGTGDDAGKSSPYYFNVFHCYEVDNTLFEENKNDWSHPLIYKNVYVPSTYYFYFGDFGYLMVNSEITVTASQIYFKDAPGLETSKGFNLYTGSYTTDGSALITNSEIYALRNTIDSMLTQLAGKKIIVGCHEMPLTVITQEYLTENETDPEISARMQADRSVQNTWDAKNSNVKKRSLIGSHLNRIHADTLWNNDYNYWFSQLLEKHNVKLCIGGHKHTYCCTYPVQEATIQSLEDYNITKKDTLHISKQIIIERAESVKYSTYFEWNTTQSLNNKGVVYFMCQATGYKIKSNKELPSKYQVFSKIVPATVPAEGKNNAKADVSQEYPMYAVISYDTNKYYIDLYRVSGIKKETMDKGKCVMKQDFSELYYSTNTMYSEKLICYYDNTEKMYINKWLSNPNISNTYKQDVDRCYLENGELKGYDANSNSPVSLDDKSFINKTHTNEVTF